MNTFRGIRRDEWLHAWHYARADRRYGKSANNHVGPLLRQAVRDVLLQDRDRLALRAQIAAEPMSGLHTAFLYTTRVGFLGRLN